MPNTVWTFHLGKSKYLIFHSTKKTTNKQELLALAVPWGTAADGCLEDLIPLSHHDHKDSQSENTVKQTLLKVVYLIIAIHYTWHLS